MKMKGRHINIDSACRICFTHLPDGLSIASPFNRDVGLCSREDRATTHGGEPAKFRGAAYAELDQPTRELLQSLDVASDLNDEEATTLLK